MKNDVLTFEASSLLTGATSASSRTTCVSIGRGAGEARPTKAKSMSLSLNAAIKTSDVSIRHF
jgi:hypothetical protein